MYEVHIYDTDASQTFCNHFTFGVFSTIKCTHAVYIDKPVFISYIYHLIPYFTDLSSEEIISFHSPKMETENIEGGYW